MQTENIVIVIAQNSAVSGAVELGPAREPGLLCPLISIIEINGGGWRHEYTMMANRTLSCKFYAHVWANRTHPLGASLSCIEHKNEYNNSKGDYPFQSNQVKVKPLRYQLLAHNNRTASTGCGFESNPGDLHVDLFRRTRGKYIIKCLIHAKSKLYSLSPKQHQRLNREITKQLINKIN